MNLGFKAATSGRRKRCNLPTRSWHPRSNIELSDTVSFRINRSERYFLKMATFAIQLPNRAEILLPARPLGALSQLNCSWFRIRGRKMCTARDKWFHFRARFRTTRARSELFCTSGILPKLLWGWLPYWFPLFLRALDEITGRQFSDACFDLNQ